MSVKQRFVVAAGLLAVLAMLIYPPFYVNYRGASYNLGRAFVFSPPKTWQVNFGLLIAQALGVLALTAGAYWVCGYLHLKAPSWLAGKPPHPWRRYFARIIDIYISAIAVSFVVGFVLFALSPSRYGGFMDLLENKMLSIFIWLAVWTLIEPFPLAFLGTTPAKWLFGIWVVDANGGRLSLSAAFKRSLLVWYKGFALGIPVFTVIAEILCYSHLKKHGTAPWDESVGSIVIHKPWDIGRVAACVALLLGILGLGWLGVASSS